jgi:6-phosphogluconate dehydrogenase (decarboxylating)
MTNLTKNIKYGSYINLYNRFIEMTKKIHYPQLDTILMVEETIQKMDYPKKTELWKSLPKKVMYQTFCMIIDYLEESGKIMIDDGRIVWTRNPETIKKIKSSGVKLR